MLINPGDSLFAAARILGVALLALGIFDLIKYFTAKEEKNVLDLVIGVVACVFGIVVLAGPAFVINIFPILEGIAIAVLGIKGLIEGIQLKYTPEIILALITIALGILLFANPFGTATVFARILGIALIYVGVSGLFKGKSGNE